MKILDYAVAKKLGIAFSGGAHSLAEKAIAQKLGGGSGGNTGGGGVAYLTFYNEDGTSVLQIVECNDGADGAYTGSTPTKASTAQYTYSFAGWSRTIGGAVDPDAMKNVTADRSLYAAFTATVRTYTVRFYNGSTLLQTVNNVPYGGSATYTGDEPADESGKPFSGWKPEPTNITGNTDCYASFKSTVGAVWTKSNLTAPQIKELSYCGGIFFAGTAGSGLYYSEDGEVWTQSNITSGNAYDVTYGNGLWVAGTSQGIYNSNDGKVWTLVHSTSGIAYELAYNGNLWVCGGSYNGIGLLYSVDGATWEASNITSGGFSPKYDAGIWVAGAMGNGLYYSEDGKTWTPSNITSGKPVYLAYGNGMWVAGCTDAAVLYYSADGKTWTQSGAAFKCASVIFANGVFIASSDADEASKVYLSTDGVSWEQVDFSFVTPLRLYYADGVYIGAGYQENVNRRGVFYSTDGRNWKQSNLTNEDFVAAYGNGVWIAGCTYSKNVGVYYSK